MFYVSRLSSAVVMLCLWGTAVHAEIVDRSKFTSAAVYQLHVDRADFRFCDANRDGAFQPSELPCYDQLRAQEVIGPPTQFVQTSPDTIMALKESAESTEPLRKEPCRKDVGILVRRSKPDIGNLNDPTCLGEAIGAEFAWANDGISGNEVWSARGLVAMPQAFKNILPQDIPYLQSLALSPYVSFDRVSNTDSVKQDIDNLGYGGLLEISVPNVWGGTQNFDIDAGLLSSFAGSAKNWAFNVNWEPGVDADGYLSKFFGSEISLGRLFQGSLHPTLQTGLANELGDLAGQPIFAENDWVLRTGPAITFSLAGKDSKVTPVPQWAQRIRYELTYSWLYDWLSGRDYGLLDTALSFGLDESGHLGLTLSYRNGDLQATGQPVDLANVALSVSY